ncbi:MAG TPA: DoxX family protein [Devosiaceae bacterium]|jgi:putative oxidoreductase|nr:DoxX family protein [Devosiaceae bacterium]
MPTDLASTLLLIGRLLFGGAFVFFGLRNLRNFQKLRPTMAEKGVPLPDLALGLGLVTQTLAGLLILLGIMVPLGAAAMIVFLILATVLYHPFWAFAGDARAPHVSAFGINSALCGGALVLIAATL